jgi:hypothetical protein
LSSRAVGSTLDARDRRAASGHARRALGPDTKAAEMERLEPAEQVPAGGVLRGTRRLLITFAVLTALAVNQLLLFADVADRYWAWTIHTEQSAAFVGAAYGAGLVLSLLSLRMTRWSQIRIPIVTVTVFTVLTTVSTFVHMHRLHLESGGPVAQGAAWLWLAVYLLVPLVCVVVVARQESDRGPAEAVTRPMSGWLTRLLLAQGLVLFVAGVLLFISGISVHHHQATTGLTSFWPWSLTPMSAMVIGAWLIAFGIAAGMAVGTGDLARLLVPSVTYTAFGLFELVAVIWHWPQVSSKDPWTWVYVGGLVAITVTGAYGWRAARQVRTGSGTRISVPSGR